MVKFVCYFMKENEFKECFDYAWTNLVKLGIHEATILFEILGCSLWSPQTHDDVKIADCIREVSYQPIDST